MDFLYFSLLTFEKPTPFGDGFFSYNVTFSAIHFYDKYDQIPEKKELLQPVQQVWIPEFPSNVTFGATS